MHLQQWRRNVAFYRKNAGCLFRTATSTTDFVVADVKTGAIRKLIPVGLTAQVVSAVPYEDGILYVDYSLDDENTLNWEIIRHAKEAREILLKGQCDFYDKLPSLEVLEGVPIVLWEDATDGKARLSKISKNGFEDIISEEENITIVTSQRIQRKFVLRLRPREKPQKWLSLGLTE